MNTRHCLWLGLSSVCFSYVGAAGDVSKAYTFTVLTTSQDPAYCPVSIDLAALGITDCTGSPGLYRIDGDVQIPVACQVESGHPLRLWFSPDLSTQSLSKTIFRLVFSQTVPSLPKLTASKDERTVTLRQGSQPILSYYHAVLPAPERTDKLYHKSGFIHPLWSPSGNILTRIQPTDHYHHYGLWNPWTRTVIEGKEVDFWNIGQGTGTVRFAELVSTESGPVFAGFVAKQEHVAFNLGSKEKVAMEETLTVRAFAGRTDQGPIWIIDYKSRFHNVLSTPIELPAYRYGGGLGFRATDDWNKENCRVVTSEGKNRDNADGTRARWCNISGSNAKNERSGILFMSHPDNHEHPEPVRVWPASENPQGYLMFDYCPIRLNSWVFEPGKDYDLQYRLVVYDGTLTPETAEQLWKQFAEPVQAVIQK